MIENPPAFPREDYQGSDAPGQSGMSLRDWFAGQALAGFLADGSQRLVEEAYRAVPEFLDMGPSKRAATVNQQVALGCFALADAMLLARYTPSNANAGRES